MFDPRNLAPSAQRNTLAPTYENATDNARGLMHGIFVGEIQALEGAGRTCFDFEIGDGRDQAPFGLKLDMARQCWDEARHVEISVKLGEHMGSEIGEFAEQTLLYEAACNPDPVLRLTGRQPGARGPGDRRVQDDARLRHDAAATRCSSSPRTGCSPTR